MVLNTGDIDDMQTLFKHDDIISKHACICSMVNEGSLESMGMLGEVPSDSRDIDLGIPVAIDFKSVGSVIANAESEWLQSMLGSSGSH